MYFYVSHSCVCERTRLSLVGVVVATCLLALGKGNLLLVFLCADTNHYWVRPLNHLGI